MELNKIIAKKNEISELDIYKKYLTIFSIVMDSHLSNLQIDILSTCYIYGDKNVSTNSRKIIKQKLNISTNQLNNYILALKKLGFITPENKIHSYLDLEITDITTLKIVFKKLPPF